VPPAAADQKEFASRLGIVIEGADEAQFWLDALVELNYGSQNVAMRLRKEAEELQSWARRAERSLRK
jgi:four helix bundle protein